MKIQQVTWQSRFDYKAIMECEHCDKTEVDNHGYDDTNYHVNVIPRYCCKWCDKNRAGDVFGKGSLRI